MTTYSKIQNVAKTITYNGTDLSKLVQDTMEKISNIVGATLGPGGRPVLIERQEYGMLPMVTKDGVTVFRSLGFTDPNAQNIMESARDAAIRTASEAGDGTTTATVLAAAIVKRISEYCKNNPNVSPQQVVRSLQKAFKDTIEPEIKKLATRVNINTEEGQKLLKDVATVSTNGDTELADAVMKCFDLVGDDGNVTLTEINGPSGYEIERIEGYPISMGYEDTLGRFSPPFINDQDSQKCVLQDTYVLVYFGRLSDMTDLAHLAQKIGENWELARGRHNLVVIATGFSEQVLASMNIAFPDPSRLNIVPVLCPYFPVSDGQLQFLQDLCVVTGQEQLIDPLHHRLSEINLAQLGTAKIFEMGRFRSNIIGNYEENEMNIFERVDQIKKQLKLGTVGQLETTYLNERIGKLVGGIAKLKIIAPSAGELRERKDRAEDAVCAVRGALKHGVLPGAGWTLIQLSALIDSDDYATMPECVEYVLSTAFIVPFEKILINMGYSNEEISLALTKLSNDYTSLVLDARNGKYVDAFEAGILDSVPAVLEAIRNSLSIAALLGTLGGIVSFKRNQDLELAEAKSAQQFERDAGIQKPELSEA